MELRPVSDTNICVSALSLGTWAFGGDKWWGSQDDKDSLTVLEAAFCGGINTIDTAPVYGRGRSERIIGAFIKKRNLRARIVLATKLGLSWDGPKIMHNLKKKRMLQELDESRKRLQTDYFDIYQAHWPDPNTPIAETASLMQEFYQKGIIRAIGVSNYSVEQMEDFMKYSPLHILQPPYNMFKREIEADIIPFCLKNNISILAYIPLHSGILTGKFFFGNTTVPGDLCRRNHRDLREPLFSINKEVLNQLKDIAQKYERTPTQLVLNWTQAKEGITSVLVGTRKSTQLEENIHGVGWKINEQDKEKIEHTLKEREAKIRAV